MSMQIIPTGVLSRFAHEYVEENRSTIKKVMALAAFTIASLVALAGVAIGYTVIGFALIPVLSIAVVIGAICIPLFLFLARKLLPQHLIQALDQPNRPSLYLTSDLEVDDDYLDRSQVEDREKLTSDSSGSSQPFEE